MSARSDALVLGVGGMGAAALAHLAARGLSVVGVEQDEVPSLRGSSAGETRVIRKAYAEDARYVPLLARAYELWHDLEARSGQALFERVGCLNLGPEDHPAIRGVLESVERHGLPHVRLGADEVRERFSLVPRSGDRGVFEQDAGYLRVEACTKAHADWAASRGARLVTRACVTDLHVGPASVRVTLQDGAILEADRLVVAAGPWLAAHPVLRALLPPTPLVVQRQVQLWLDPADPVSTSPPALPAFIHFLPDRAFYGVPPDPSHPAPAVKVCRHHGGDPTAPDALDRALRPDDEAQVRAYVRAHLPAADGPLRRARVCMYTCTADEHFLVGALPAAPHVVILGGFSGHVYKMASVIGEIAADLVERGR
ncbi:MAG: N-methyl-L-tryptophan oxidase [Polyangiaceae bacterium]